MMQSPQINTQQLLPSVTETPDSDPAKLQAPGQSPANLADPAVHEQQQNGQPVDLPACEQTPSLDHLLPEAHDEGGLGFVAEPNSCRSFSECCNGSC